jgi:hypothetical protein
MARRLALAASVAALALTLPAFAQAATYCVNAPGCPGTNEPDLQTALTAAQGTTAEGDTVQVGDPGPPTTGYSYSDGGNSANQVNIVGAGRSATVLTATSGSSVVLALQGPGSTVSHLTLRIPQGGQYGAQTNGSFNDVDVTSADPGTASQTGVYFFGTNSTWQGGSLTLPSGSGSDTGTYASTPGVSYTLEDVAVNVDDTAVLGGQGTVTLRRVKIVSGIGIVASGETLVADNVTFRALPVTNPIFMVVNPTSTLDASASVNHVSALGTGGSNSLGFIVTSGSAGRSATLNLRNSIVRNFFFTIDRNASGSGASANATVSYSDIDLVHVIDSNSSGGTGTLTHGPGNSDNDPLWANAPEADFGLRAGSPAIDAGDPAGLLPGDSDTDVLGAPRIVGGRTDMGAVEFVPPAPPPPPDTSPPTFKTSKLPKKLTLKKLLAGLTFTIVPSEPSSIDATLAGSARSVKLAKTYNVTLAHRKLGLAAGRRRVTLKVRKKLLGKSRKFSVQLTVALTDAAGNKATLRRTIKVR